MTWPWRERKARRLDRQIANSEKLLGDIYRQAMTHQDEARRLWDEWGTTSAESWDLRQRRSVLRSTPWWKPIRGVR